MLKVKGNVQVRYTCLDEVSSANSSKLKPMVKLDFIQFDCMQSTYLNRLILIRRYIY